MKVLVTGATGFLGKYVVEELAEQGYQVRAFGRNLKAGRQLEGPLVEFFAGDFTREEEIFAACEGVDAVVHAGALSTIWGPWEQFYQTNVVGTKLVMEACRHFGVQRLVYISSPSVYAAPRDQLAIKEEAAPQENELNFYIKSKLMAERIVRSYPQVPSVILRPRGLFGIGDTSIFPRILRLSQKLAIPLIRNGQQMMDMTCVENVALAVRLALEFPEAQGQVYNITNGESRSFKDMLDEALDSLQVRKRYVKLPAAFLGLLAQGFESFYRFFNIEKEPPLTLYTYYLMRYSQTLDISAAVRDLGYQPKLTISEGIAKYVQHYREN